jgi:TolB-like protein/DNA-binding winged helix-turn-helix (wHTH) protein/Flp pilus assembly protein TadD
MNQQPDRFTYEFGEFRIDPQRRVLLSRSSHQPVQVTGRVFDTLLYLVEHAGDLLDKRTLMEALWPLVVVEESNLTQTIHTLRRILGERPGEHRYIVTVPGRGYRFVAGVTTREVQQEPLAAPESHAPLRFAHRRVVSAVALTFLVLAIAAGMLVLKPAPIVPQVSAATGMRTVSLAVLPFVDMSGEKDQVHFADGLSEEILNLLAQSSSMRIIARTSSFSFKNRQDLPIETIARKLNATHVLEGSVRKSGRRLRVTAQLVDGTTSAHLWSQTFDRDLTDIFSVQDEIAAAVTDSLHAQLQDGQSIQRADTTSAQAYEQYLYGRYFFNRRGESDVARARDYFQKALQTDSAYARAWAGLAGTYLATLDSGQTPDTKMQQAWLKAIEQGLSLGPGIAETHVRAAQYYWWLGDWRRSEEHCKMAIALNPSDSLVLSVSATKAIAKGHLHEAIALQRHAVAVDPLSALGRANLGSYLAAAGELKEAEVEFMHARELSPTLPLINLGIAHVLVLQQRFDESLALIEQMPAGAMRDQSLALTHYGAGNRPAADAALAALIARANDPDAEPSLKIWVAEVHAFRGEREQALQFIEQVLTADRSATMHANVWARIGIQISPFFGALKDHTRWQPMLASAH